jgi:7-cyano-7-deazaguanine synthase
MGERCIVILSGGPDSTTLAYWAKAEGYEAHAVIFNYGQRAQREIEYAVKTAERLNMPYKVLDISSLKELYTGVTSLVDPGMKVASSFEGSLIVPFRNGIFLSIAVAYASSIGARRIFYGAHIEDGSFYPDCRREFYKAFEASARLGTGEEITIEAPFGDIPKSEILRRGYELGVPYELTWSCYLNGPKHCGVCESCRNRRMAFREAGLADPTEYGE